ncbi:aminotransferase [Candidatus Peregrinibacteria bacterium RIFOXYA12_FULL_33_12]|nr:MAG: aminotransferase [Candidatus Peregrinibacteria bacterium RIFOXYA12_FULL_33_12]
MKNNFLKTKKTLKQYKQIEFNVLDREFKKHQNEYTNAIAKVLESGWYILGKEVEEFEKKFSNFINAKYCVGLNSGLDALILAIRSLNISCDDEVIVPANTYIATVLGITENKAKPIFVEPDEYYNLDADKIEAAITPKTKAILVVHLYGQAANIKKIRNIAKKHNLFLIEDCAQSHGAKFYNQTTGTFGDIGCFSFYPTKNLGAFGDAGAIVTNNKKIFKKIRLLRNYGSEIKYQHEIEGVNSRLDEIQAAVLNVKLSHFKKLITNRENLAFAYLNKIKNPKIILPTIRKGADHIWHLFIIRTKDRNKLQKYLLNKNIKTMIHYPIPPHLSKAYKKFNFKKGNLPITEEYADTLLSLPLYDGMNNKEINYVIETINKY